MVMMSTNWFGPSKNSFIMTYRFDGSYHGFLSAIFESFERKHFNVQPISAELVNASMFDDIFEIQTDALHAERVLKGLKKYLPSSDIYDIYKVFLSENESSWYALFAIIQKIFLGHPNILDNYGDVNVINFSQTLTKVDRERHRMKAFIRFQKDNNNMFYAIVEPDFNVLPLIIKFFTDRYRDQNWLIYDIKRKYGLFYNIETVTEVYFSETEKNQLARQDSFVSIDEKEEHFQNLWKQYFKSTNIEARKNIKLHLQHVPKRYWKYLVEKQ